jgi:hypothetical protein
LDTDEEVDKYFTRQVQHNLHVVFTMNPANADFNSRAATSPALFNRCVVDWFGSWSQEALVQVASSFTETMDLAFVSKEVGTGTGTLRSSSSSGGSTGAPAAAAAAWHPAKLSSHGRLQLSIAEAARYKDVVAVVVPPTGEEGSGGGGGRGGGGGGGVADVVAPLSYRDAVIASLVHIHMSVKAMCEKANQKKLTARAGGGRGGTSAMGGGSLSPRDFLDLITHYVTVTQEKRAQLEEQQLHLNIGLEKLKTTELQVAELRIRLGQKESELELKAAQANAKLQDMVAKQQEAETKKTDAMVLSSDLRVQDKAIQERKASVEGELAEAEPALVEAGRAVRNIQKKQLDEVRSMARPPPMVKHTMEMVAVLFGENKEDWSEVRRFIRRDDFLQGIFNFDPESITLKQRQTILSQYVENEELDINYDLVNRASSACGPLYQWVVSQGQSVTPPLTHALPRLPSRTPFGILLCWVWVCTCKQMGMGGCVPCHSHACLLAWALHTHTLTQSYPILSYPRDTRVSLSLSRSLALSLSLSLSLVLCVFVSLSASLLQ